MKKAFVVFLIAVGLLVTAGNVFAGNGTINASVITSETLTEATQMNFGLIIPSATAGTITLAPYNVSGNVSVATTGGVAVASGTKVTTANALSSGKFTMTVPANSGLKTYFVYLSDRVPVTSGANSMYADTFLAYASLDSGTLTSVSSSGYQVADSTGIQTVSFVIGATLHVNGSQNTGTYTGTYSIIVNTTEY